MSGLVMAPLTEHELERLQAWYLAHHLAEENTEADDRLVTKLKGYSRTVACKPRSACQSGQCSVPPRGCSSGHCAPTTNQLRTEAWGGGAE